MDRIDSALMTMSEIIAKMDELNIEATIYRFPGCGHSTWSANLSFTENGVKIEAKVELDDEIPY